MNHTHPIFKTLLDAIAPAEKQPETPACAEGTRLHKLAMAPTTAFDDLALTDKLDILATKFKNSVYECAVIEALPNSDEYELWLHKLIDSSYADADIGRLARQIVCAYVSEVARCRGDALASS